jgi:hypothetical protein
MNCFRKWCCCRPQDFSDIIATLNKIFKKAGHNYDKELTVFYCLFKNNKHLKNIDTLREYVSSQVTLKTDRDDVFKDVVYSISKLFNSRYKYSEFEQFFKFISLEDKNEKTLVVLNSLYQNAYEEEGLHMDYIDGLLSLIKLILLKNEFN